MPTRDRVLCQLLCEIFLGENVRDGLYGQEPSSILKTVRFNSILHLSLQKCFELNCEGLAGHGEPYNRLSS